jgi:hypothetical protein
MLKGGLFALVWPYVLFTPLIKGLTVMGRAEALNMTVMLNTKGKTYTHYDLKKMYLFGCG